MQILTNPTKLSHKYVDASFQLDSAFRQAFTCIAAINKDQCWYTYTSGLLDLFLPLKYSGIALLSMAWTLETEGKTLTKTKSIRQNNYHQTHHSQGSFALKNKLEQTVIDRGLAAI